jgi:hypothetical protein
MDTIAGARDENGETFSREPARGRKAYAIASAGAGDQSGTEIAITSVLFTPVRILGGGEVCHCGSPRRGGGDAPHIIRRRDE